MKLKRYLLLLKIFSRPFGAGQFNSDGRLTKWYAVTLINFIVSNVGKVLYLHRVFSTLNKNYFTDRPFQMILVLLSMVASCGNSIATISQLRMAVTVQDMAKIELVSRRNISYSSGFLILDLGVLAFVRCCHASITCLMFYKNGILKAQDAFVTFISRYYPEVLDYVALMHYCCILQIFGQQLRSIRRSNIENTRLASMHSHAIRCVNSLHRSYRWQILFGVTYCVVSMIWNYIFLHERFLGVIRDDGYTLGRLFNSYPLVILVFQLFNVFKSCHIIRNEVERLLEEIFLREMKRNVAADKRLKTYLMSKPKLDLSVGRFLEPSMGLFIELLSSTVFFYLLMVQMNVLKSTFSSSV